MATFPVNNFSVNMNDQFKQLMDLQAKSLEPMRAFASVASDAVEQVARYNYAVVGDVLEYSVKQVNLPFSSDKLSDVAAAQVAEANSFVEVMSGRASEYAEMAQQFSGKVREAAESVSASFK